MSSLVLPTPKQLGRELRASDFETTEGFCSANVEGSSLIMTVEGLPPITTSLDGPYYQVILDLSDEPIGVQATAIATGGGAAPSALLSSSAGVWIDVSEGFGDAMTAPAIGSSAGAVVQAVSLGRITPNPQGSASLTLTRAPFDLSYVSGARIEIVVPDSSGMLTFPVLSGEVGNLVGDGEDPLPPDDDGGGHHH